MNFVLSHRLRERINTHCNEAEAQGRNDAVRFTLEEFGLSDLNPHQSNPQDAFFWPGQRVIACCGGRRLRNGLVYEIESLGEQVVIRRPDVMDLAQFSEDAAAIDDDDVTDSDRSSLESNIAATIELPQAKFFRSVRLTHAVTYASIQGLTIDGLIALHDTSHHHFRAKHLFVALSRARGASSIIVH